MSTATTDLSQYNGKKVIVTRNLPEPNEAGESAVEVEGLVQVGNAFGLLIKPKGKVQFDLIPVDEIEEVTAQASATKTFKASKLAPVKKDNVRRHLLDRHGVDLDWANSVSEEDAAAYHDSLDHVALKLGHVHVEKEKKDKDEDDSE